MGTYLPRIADTPREYVAPMCNRIRCPKSPVAPLKLCACSLCQNSHPKNVMKNLPKCGLRRKKKKSC